MRGLGQTGAVPRPDSKYGSRKPLTILPGAAPPDSPAPADGLLPTVVAAWDTFWASPLRATVIESDMPALRRLFEFYDQRERFTEEGMRNPITTGSTGQEIVSALLRQVDVLDSKILALEDRFGMSPLSRLRLQVKVGDASRSIAETNARLAASTLLDGEDEPDLRRPARKRVPSA